MTGQLREKTEGSLDKGQNRESYTLDSQTQDGRITHEHNRGTNYSKTENSTNRSTEKTVEGGKEESVEEVCIRINKLLETARFNDPANKERVEQFIKTAEAWARQNPNACEAVQEKRRTLVLEIVEQVMEDDEKGRRDQIREPQGWCRSR